VPLSVEVGIKPMLEAEFGRTMVMGGDRMLEDTELDESVKEAKLIRQLNLERDRLGLGDEWGDYGVLRRSSSFRICASCKSFQYVRSEHKVLNTSCGAMRGFKPNAADPVVECTAYEKIGTMSLQDMANIATLIEVKAEKDPVGFRNNGKEKPQGT
jgi:hypothetical protein